MNWEFNYISQDNCVVNIGNQFADSLFLMWFSCLVSRQVAWSLWSHWRHLCYFNGNKTYCGWSPIALMHSLVNHESISFWFCRICASHLSFTPENACLGAWSRLVLTTWKLCSHWNLYCLCKLCSHCNRSNGPVLVVYFGSLILSFWVQEQL